LSAGYSGTPLAKKLGLKDGQRCWWSEMPPSVRTEIETAGLTLTHLDGPEPPIDAAHVFLTTRAELDQAIATLRPALAPAGFAWISWPKRSSGVTSEVTEDDVRTVALPTGLVDVKVCAVDQTWSGLKLVIRKGLR